MLFIDELLQYGFNYHVSNYMYIGLKQLLGSNCEIAYPAFVHYEDYDDLVIKSLTEATYADPLDPDVKHRVESWQKYQDIVSTDNSTARGSDAFGNL